MEVCIGARPGVGASSLEELLLGDFAAIVFEKFPMILRAPFVVDRMRDRYGSAAALCADIERWLGDERVKAYRDSLVERVSRLARCHRSWVHAGAVAALLITVCSVVAAVLINAARQQAQQLAEDKAALAQRQLRLRAEAEHNLYHSIVGEARAKRLARQPGFRPEVWKLLREAMSLRSQSEDRRQLRDEAVASLGDFVGFQPRIIHEEQSLHALAVDPTGERFALANAEGTISVRDLSTGAERSNLETSEEIGAVHFTADGKKLITVSTSHLAEWQATDGGWTKAWSHVVSGKMTATTSSEESTNIPTSVTPDGKYLALVEKTPDGESISVWDLIDQKRIKSFQADDDCRCVTISPSGGWFLAGYFPAEDSKVEVWSLESDSPVHTLRPEFGRLWSASVNRDGSRLALSFQGGIIVYETQGFQPVFSRRGYAGESIAFSATRPVIAVGTKSQGIVLFAYSVDKQVAALHYEARPAFVAFGSDGGTLVAAGGHGCYIYRLATEEKLVFEGHTINAAGVTFSPDGIRLASIGNDKKARVWNTANGRLLTTFELAQPANSIAFYRDGRRLVTDGASPGGVWIWDTLTGKRLQEIEFGDPWAVAFSPDGRFFACCDDQGGLQLWEINGAGKDDPGAALPLQRIQGPVTQREVLHVAFSPDSRLLV